MGVNEISLVITQKVHRGFTQKDLERMHKVIIAAREQAKYFAPVKLNNPVLLEQVIESNTYLPCLFFDPQGESAANVIETLQANKHEKILAMVGPEGDLSFEEKELLRSKGFIFCALTPTILRSFQAATLAMGLLRSLL